MHVACRLLFVARSRERRWNTCCLTNYCSYIFKKTTMGTDVFEQLVWEHMRKTLWRQPFFARLCRMHLPKSVWERVLLKSCWRSKSKKRYGNSVFWQAVVGTHWKPLWEQVFLSSWCKNTCETHYGNTRFFAKLCQKHVPKPLWEQRFFEKPSEEWEQKPLWEQRCCWQATAQTLSKTIMGTCVFELLV